MQQLFCRHSYRAWQRALVHQRLERMRTRMARRKSCADGRVLALNFRGASKGGGGRICYAPFVSTSRLGWDVPFVTLTADVPFVPCEGLPGSARPVCVAAKMFVSVPCPVCGLQLLASENSSHAWLAGFTSHRPEAKHARSLDLDGPTGSHEGNQCHRRALPVCGPPGRPLSRRLSRDMAQRSVLMWVGV